MSTAPQLPKIVLLDGHLTCDKKSPFLMRGINLGGWLVEEIWMLPIVENDENRKELPEVRDDDSLWFVIEQRLGKTSRTRIRNAWRDSWITKQDFEKIKQIGFNHIRLPFLHTLLDEPKGMDRIKWAVEMARQNGLYVLLDMHGAPGGQSTEHHTGKCDQNKLWTDPSCVEEMARKWVRLAKEFKDDNTVFSYDIMNEPMGAPNGEAIVKVYDQVITAIRKVDPNKPVMVEDGYKGIGSFTTNYFKKWGPVIASVHFYNFGAKKKSEHAEALNGWIGAADSYIKDQKVPMYAGEFNVEPNSSPETTVEIIDLLEKRSWSWAIWTYKAFSRWGQLGQWGIFRPEGKPTPINPYVDDEKTMIQKIAAFRTENIKGNEAYIKALTERLHR